MIHKQAPMILMIFIKMVVAKSAYWPNRCYTHQYPSMETGGIKRSVPLYNFIKSNHQSGYWPMNDKFCRGTFAERFFKKKAHQALSE